MPVIYNADQPDALPSLSILDAVNMIRDTGEERIAGCLESIQNGVNSLADQLSQAADGRFDQLYVTDSQTGEVIAKIGSFESLSGLATVRLWVGGNVDSPESTAPFYVDNNGKLQFFLGDGDDAAALEVLDAGGNTVVWAGKSGSYYGIAAENIWIGPGADPTTAPFYSDGTQVVIGNNGYVVLLDGNGDENGWMGARTISTVDYAGGWAREWRIGGDDTTSAVIVADANGDVLIAGGDIYLGPGASGLGGRLFSYTGSTLTGWVGSGDVAAPVTISNISGGTVTTAAAHGLTAGKYAYITGTSNPHHNKRVVLVATAPTSTTYTVAGLTGTSTGGTSTKQLTGAWYQECRIGGTGPTTANVVSDSTGVSITDAIIVVNGTYSGANYVFTASPSDVKIQATTAQVTQRLTAAAVDITDDTGPTDRTSSFSLGRSIVKWNSAAVETLVGATKSTLSIKDPTALEVFLFDSSVGMKVSGSTVIDTLRNASFTTLSLLAALPVNQGGTGARTIADARDNLDVYSTTETDTAVANGVSTAEAWVTSQNYATQSWVLSLLAGYVTNSTYSGHHHQVSGVTAGASTVTSGLPL